MLTAPMRIPPRLDRCKTVGDGACQRGTCTQILEGSGSPGPVSVMQFSGETFKTGGSVEASFAKQPLSNTITKADVKEIRRLYEKGYSSRVSVSSLG